MENQMQYFIIDLLFQGSKLVLKTIKIYFHSPLWFLINDVRFPNYQLNLFDVQANEELKIFSLKLRACPFYFLVLYCDFMLCYICLNLNITISHSYQIASLAYANLTGGFSEAELVAICREVALFAIEEDEELQESEKHQQLQQQQDSATQTG